MGLKLSLFLLSLFSFVIFTIFSYTVAREAWQTTDFDTTVKLQDHLPSRFDKYLSYLSLFGSAEVTFSIALIMAGYSLFKKRFLAIIGWLLIIPASMFEIFGKLVVFHPGPPVLFHRTIVETHLPSFYIHTNFSYPSGHLTRTIFLVVVFMILVYFNHNKPLSKLVMLSALLIYAGLMFMSRISLGEHWLSDTVGGSLLGFSTALLAGVLILPKKLRFKQ